MTLRQGAAALGAAVMMAVWTASAAAQVRAPQTPQYTVADRPAGVNLYAPGEWGVVAIGVVNPTDQPAEVLAALHFDGDPSLQYGRQFWLPPRSRRATWYPLLTPDVPKDKGRVAIKALLIDRTPDREQFIESRSGQMFQPGLLTVEHESPVTGVFADPDDADPRNMLIAARLGREMSWRLAGLRGETPPVSIETLGAIDQLAISSDAVVSDAALLLAIRRWVYDGGQVWLMLDELDPETARRLLGDLFQVQVVDRVDLTDFQMEGRRPNGQVWQGAPRQFDEPVPFVRVLAPDRKSVV